MAIYSLNHSVIGKTTHAAGTAGAHVRYITRIQARPDIVAHLIPANRNEARAWMGDHETLGRKNARVCDKLILALPIELSAVQRKTLLRDFADQVTEGRAPYFAAIHAFGKDERNPHAHLILVDRDPDTGKRVMLTSEKGSTERFRERWEMVCNYHLALAGVEGRIDRRTLEEQGVSRMPQIHVGAEGKYISEHVQRPESTMKEVKNATGAKTKKRDVDYPKIDAGRTRQQFNDQIIDYNLEQAKKSPDFATRKRAELAQKVRAMAKEEEQRVAETRREIVQKAREDRKAIYAMHQATVKTLTEARDTRLAAAKEEVREDYSTKWHLHAQQKAQSREGLRTGESFRRKSATRSNAAIKAMKRGDYVAGHLKQAFTHPAQLFQHRQQLRLQEIKIERSLRERERTDLKTRTDTIREQSREAYVQERARYTAERTTQKEAVRETWKDFQKQTNAAQKARADFAEQQGREIERIAGAIGKASSGWARAASHEQSNAPASSQPQRRTPSLGR